MSSNDDWTITLFPTMPLALLAAIRITATPALVLVEDDSVLNGHVSTLQISQQGYSIRTFNQQAALDRAGREQLVPSHQLAVHRDFDALNTRFSETYNSRAIGSIWNHVENLTEQDLFNLSSQVQARPQSATLRLPGCPGAVALLLEHESQAQIADVAQALGLHYQNGLSL
jgi:hypothetical protein